MEITFDQAKREKTLKERGLDFAGAKEVFAGRHTVRLDNRFDYGGTIHNCRLPARKDGRTGIDVAR